MKQEAKKRGRPRKEEQEKEGAICKHCGKAYEITYPQQSKTCCPECNMAIYQGRKLKKRVSEIPEKKVKLKGTVFEEIIPHVNTGDEFSRQFIGRVMQI